MQHATALRNVYVSRSWQVVYQEVMTRGWFRATWLYAQGGLRKETAVRELKKLGASGASTTPMQVQKGGMSLP